MVSAPVVCAGCGETFLGKGRAKWCSEKCRKGSYGQACIGCGVRTVHGAERRRAAEPRCKKCADVHRMVWTREALLAAIRDWHEMYGAPPAGADWNAWQARSMGDETRAKRFEDADGRWPSHMRLVDVFGSWNAGIAAAGFVGRPAHGVAGRRRATVTA